jgi:hypothetical protein
MKWLLRFVLLAGLCAGADATTIDSYASRLDVAENGSARVTVTLQLGNCQPGRIRLPIAFAKLDAFQTGNVPDGVQLELAQGKDQSIVDIELPVSIKDAAKVSFSFSTPDVLGRPKLGPGEKSRLAADTQVLKYNFVNTQALAIGSYRVEARLPDEMRVQKIGEQLPKPKRSDVLPRVQLGKFDGHQGATLQFENVKQGDRTSMVLEVVGDGRSYGWLLAGLLISVAYLVGFRDLVKPAKP